MKKNFGFTLIELLVTIAIAAILVALAIPGMNTLSSQQNVISPLKGLRGVASYGHDLSEDKKVPVVICSSADGQNCAGSTVWEQGWIMFRDRNDNQVTDTGTGACLPTEDCIERVQDALPTGVTLRADANWLAFTDEGDRRTGSGTVFRLCGKDALPVNDPDDSRTVRINAAGIISAAMGTTTCP